MTTDITTAQAKDQAGTFLERARAYAIVDDATRDAAALDLAECKRRIKIIEADLRPGVDDANALHKKLLANLKAHTLPYTVADDVLTPKIGVYDADQIRKRQEAERKQREETARLQREAEAKAEAERLRLQKIADDAARAEKERLEAEERKRVARELAELGATDEEVSAAVADVVVEGPAPVIITAVAPKFIPTPDVIKPVNTTGTSSRLVWNWELEYPNGAGVPRNLCSPDSRKINERKTGLVNWLDRQGKTEVIVDGIRYMQVAQVMTRAAK